MPLELAPRRWGLYSKTMPRKMALILVLVLLAALCVSGVAILLMFRPAEHLSQTDLQPRFPIERPFEVLISCEVHKQHGWTWYGGDAPIRALFAGCKPQGDFYLVGTPSTRKKFVPPEINRRSHSC